MSQAYTIVGFVLFTVMCGTGKTLQKLASQIFVLNKRPFKMAYLAASRSRRVLEVSAVKTAMCKSLFLDADRGHFNECSLIAEKRPVKSLSSHITGL